MTSQQLNKFFEFAVGSKVICNGYPGVIEKMHTGQLAGMADVRLASGVVCDSLENLTTPLINHVESIETYQLVASNGKPIRKATKVIFSDGFEVKFLDRIPSKTDAINQALAVRGR